MTNVPMRRRGPYEYTVTVIGCIMAVIGLGFGISLIAGSPRRTAGPAFENIRDAMPIEAWGLLYVLCGTAVLLGQGLQWSRVVAGAHALLCLISFFWSAAFFAAYLRLDTVSSTGFAFGSGIALIHWAVAVAAWRS